MGTCCDIGSCAQEVRLRWNQEDVGRGLWWGLSIFYGVGGVTGKSRIWGSHKMQGSLGYQKRRRVRDRI